MSNSISADTGARETGKFTMTGTANDVSYYRNARISDCTELTKGFHNVAGFRGGVQAAYRSWIGRGSIFQWFTVDFQGVSWVLPHESAEDQRERTGEERRSLGLHRDRDDEHQVHRDWTTKPCMHRRCNADIGPNALHPCL